jgi:hypothetical protein
MRKHFNIHLCLLFITMMLASTVVRAQAEINVDISKDSGGGGWYTNPIIWIVGAALFILLLVALLRGGKK